MRHGLSDRIAGLMAVAAGCVFVREAWKLYRYRTDLWIGDHVFPGLVGIGLLLSGAMLLLSPKVSREEEAPGQAGGLRRRVAAVPAVLFGYTLVLPWAGYVLSTLAAALLLFRTIGGFRWRTCLWMAALAAVFMGLLFVEWLHTPLPAGKMFELRGVMAR